MSSYGLRIPVIITNCSYEFVIPHSKMVYYLASLFLKAVATRNQGNQCDYQTNPPCCRVVVRVAGKGAQQYGMLVCKLSSADSGA